MATVARGSARARPVLTRRVRLGDHAWVRTRAIGDTALSGAGRWSRVDSLLVLALLAAFLLSRILWIGALPGSSQYWEESYRWLAVEALADRPVLPFLDYQADHYQGGSLVVIGLATGLARAGLDGWVALKTVALGFSSATLVALFLLGRLFFGRLVGALAATIYLCGPPLVAYWGVVAMGFHAESALLSLATVGLLLVWADGAGRSSRAAFGFGLMAGLSIWFTPTAAIGVAACALAWPFLAAWPRARALCISGRTRKRSRLRVRSTKIVPIERPTGPIRGQRATSARATNIPGATDQRAMMSM